MKKIVGWPVCELLYWVGHFCSVVMNRVDGELTAKLLYPVYNHCMLWSADVNDWAGLKRWKKANDKA